jgi:hypothetical protein
MVMSKATFVVISMATPMTFFDGRIDCNIDGYVDGHIRGHIEGLIDGHIVGLFPMAFR